jgi:hypothetical protein
MLFDTCDETIFKHLILVLKLILNVSDDFETFLEKMKMFQNEDLLEDFYNYEYMYLTLKFSESITKKDYIKGYKTWLRKNKIETILKLKK